MQRPLFSKLPPNRNEGWQLVKTFVENWHQLFLEESRATASKISGIESTLGFPLPAALREWYLLAGKHAQIWSGQDCLLKLSELKFSLDDDALVFRYENQNCERWGIRREDLKLDDPPVWSFEEKREESPSVTAFAIQTLLLESMWRKPLMSNSGVADAEVTGYLSSLSPCDLPSHYWVLSPVFFFEAEDLFAIQTESDAFIYIFGRNEIALEQIPSRIRKKLESLD